MSNQHCILFLNCLIYNNFIKREYHKLIVVIIYYYFLLFLVLNNTYFITYVFFYFSPQCPECYRPRRP